MNERAEQILDKTDSKLSPKDWAHSRSGESLSSKKVPANESSCLAITPLELFDCAQKDQVDVQIDENGSTPTNWIGVSTEGDIARHRGRSRIRHQRRSGTASYATSKSRIRSPGALAGLKYGTSPVGLLGVGGTVQSASYQQSSDTNSAAFVILRPRAACKFSYEDYKHTQIMGWLERGAMGKEVIITYVSSFSPATDCQSRNKQLST
jgi:hypothetical protein